MKYRRLHALRKTLAWLREQLAALPTVYYNYSIPEMCEVCEEDYYNLHYLPLSSTHAYAGKWVCHGCLYSRQPGIVLAPRPDGQPPLMVNENTALSAAAFRNRVTHRNGALGSPTYLDIIAKSSRGRASQFREQRPNEV